VCDGEGCEESEEAIKAWHSDVGAWLTRLKASEGRPATDAAAFQTTWRSQGCNSYCVLNADNIISDVMYI